MSKPKRQGNYANPKLPYFKYLVAIAYYDRSLTPTQVAIASRISMLDSFSNSISHLEDILNKSSDGLYDDLTKLCDRGILFKKLVKTDKSNFSRYVYVSKFNKDGHIKPMAEIIESLERGVKALEFHYRGDDSLIKQLANTADLAIDF